MKYFLILIISYISLANSNYCLYKILGHNNYVYLNSSNVSQLNKKISIECNCKTITNQIQFSKYEKFILLSPGAKHVTPTTEDITNCSIKLKNKSNKNYKNLYITASNGSDTKLISTTRIVKAKENIKYDISIFNESLINSIKNNKKIKCDVVSIEED